MDNLDQRILQSDCQKYMYPEELYQKLADYIN